MTVPNLPTYLQNRPGPALAERAMVGIGSARPPHISIGSNRFTLVDQNGNELAVPTLYLDVCIVDICDVICKRFYGPDKPYDRNNPEPPRCWSTNGVAPSREALQPQSPTCQACPQNVRGSDTSKMSNVPIKACRDEQHWAVLAPDYAASMLFQFVLTPGSFGNWRAYAAETQARAKAGGPDLRDVMTRIEFDVDDGQTGVLKFSLRPWVQGGLPPFIDEATAIAGNNALMSKATDALVGRTDQPAQLAAPVQQQALPNQAPTINLGGQHSIVMQQPPQQMLPPATAPGNLPLAGTPFGAPQGGTPTGQPAGSTGFGGPGHAEAALQSFASGNMQAAQNVPFGAGPAASPLTNMAPNSAPAEFAQPAPSATSPSEPPKTRKRRTAQPQQLDAFGPAGQPPAQAPFPTGPAPTPAPNPPVPPPQGFQPAVGPGTFGMAAGQPIQGNPALVGMLESIYRKQG